VVFQRGRVGARGMLLPPAQQPLARRLHPVRPVRRLSLRLIQETGVRLNEL
jgi:hypothetical protein